MCPHAIIAYRSHKWAHVFRAFFDNQLVVEVCRFGNMMCRVHPCHPRVNLPILTSIGSDLLFFHLRRRTSTGYLRNSRRASSVSRSFWVAHRFSMCRESRSEPDLKGKTSRRHIWPSPKKVDKKSSKGGGHHAHWLSPQYHHSCPCPKAKKAPERPYLHAEGNPRY